MFGYLEHRVSGVAMFWLMFRPRISRSPQTGMRRWNRRNSAGMRCYSGPCSSQRFRIAASQNINRTAAAIRTDQRASGLGNSRIDSSTSPASRTITPNGLELDRLDNIDHFY